MADQSVPLTGRMPRTRLPNSSVFRKTGQNTAKSKGKNPSVSIKLLAQVGPDVLHTAEANMLSLADLLFRLQAPPNFRLIRSS
jgi:hypothetical protein